MAGAELPVPRTVVVSTVGQTESPPGVEELPRVHWVTLLEVVSRASLKPLLLELFLPEPRCSRPSNEGCLHVAPRVPMSFHATSPASWLSVHPSPPSGRLSWRLFRLGGSSPVVLCRPLPSGKVCQAQSPAEGVRLSASKSSYRCL